jgi:hypothetical protein
MVSMQPQYPPPYRFTPPPPPRPVPTPAVLSLVFGILSLLCAGFLSGIPAVVLGIVARRRIAASNGALAGQGLAIGGLVTGAIGSVLTLALTALIVLGVVVDERRPAVESVSSEQVTVRKLRFDQVELHPSGDPLVSQLQHQATLAKEVGERPFVLLHAQWCMPCKQLEREIERSDGVRLAGLRLIKLDVDEFEEELGGVGLSSGAIPAVCKLGPDGHAQGRPHVGDGLDELVRFVKAE